MTPRAARSLLLLIALSLVLTGCPDGSGPASPGPGPGPGPDDPGPGTPPAKTAAIRLVEGTATMPAGTSVVVAEDFNTVGLTQIEWDFDFDGTTFTIDLAQTPPAIPGPPVRINLPTPGTKTIALRGRYPGDVLSPVATLALTITPAHDPARFAPESRDIGSLIYEAPVFRGAYTNVQARGGQAIAVNGAQLCAGFWAILNGVPGYFLTGSPDGGGRWTTPQFVSMETGDQPTILREPVLVLCPAGGGFLAVWQAAADTSLRSTTAWLSDAPVAMTLTPVQTLPAIAGATLATAPALFADPANGNEGRLLFGQATASAKNLTVQPWSIAGTSISWGTAVQHPFAGQPSRIRGAWAGPVQLIALEHRKVTLGGGTSGGGASSLEIKVEFVSFTTPGNMRNTPALSKSGNPQRIQDYEPTLTATADRFLIAWIDEGQPPFSEGGVSLASGSYSATAAAIDTFYPMLTPREDIANLALVATNDSFVLAYTLPRLDVDPAIATDRSEELYGARLPLSAGAALYMDDPINTGDPDGNEGLEQPSLTVDANGTIYAVWAESTWNRKPLGRVGFNRTG